MSLLSASFFEIYHRRSAAKIHNASALTDAIFSSPEFRSKTGSRGSSYGWQCSLIEKPSPAPVPVKLIPPPPPPPPIPASVVNKRDQPTLLQPQAVYTSTSNESNTSSRRTVEWINSLQVPHINVAGTTPSEGSSTLRAAHITCSNAKPVGDHQQRDRCDSTPIDECPSRTSSVEMPPPPAPSATLKKSGRLQKSDLQSDSGFVDDSVEKKIIVESWALRANKSSICIESFMNNERGNTSSIVKRIDSRTVMSKTGTIYKLIGFIDSKRTIQNGFSKLFVAKFRCGFPATWKWIVEGHINERRSDKPNRKNLELQSNETTMFPTNRSGRIRYPPWDRQTTTITDLDDSTKIEPTSSKRPVRLGPQLPVACTCRKPTSNVACQTNIVLTSVASQTELVVNHAPVLVLPSVQDQARVPASKSGSVKRAAQKAVAGVKNRCPLINSEKSVLVEKMGLRPRNNSRAKYVTGQEKKAMDEEDARVSRREMARVPKVSPERAATIVHEDITLQGADTRKAKRTRVQRDEPTVTEPDTSFSIAKPSTSRPPRQTRRGRNVKSEGANEKPKVKCKEAVTDKEKTKVAGRNTLRFRRQCHEMVATMIRDDDDSDNEDLFCTTPYISISKIKGLASLRLNSKNVGGTEEEDNHNGGQQTPLIEANRANYLLQPISAAKTPNLHSGVSPFAAPTENLKGNQKEIERYIWNRKKRKRKEAKNKILMPPRSPDLRPKARIETSLPLLSRSTLSSARNFSFDLARRRPEDEEEDEDDDYYFTDDDE